MEVYQALIIAAVTGGASSIATVAAIKVDIKWVKLTCATLKHEIEELELRIRSLELKKI
ncbi:hypothetical protein [uncultured Photobacterium sp.]|uniref:hypothetical protein n=1 Tax=uncultured Photobacterium sp. TaxID=173973 RepID=UPI0026349D4B|nr:hypothetical protein [uncultured Photobacterium sp.]